MILPFPAFNCLGPRCTQDPSPPGEGAFLFPFPRCYAPYQRHYDRVGCLATGIIGLLSPRGERYLDWGEALWLTETVSPPVSRRDVRTMRDGSRDSCVVQCSLWAPGEVRGEEPWVVANPPCELPALALRGSRVSRSSTLRLKQFVNILAEFFLPASKNLSLEEGKLSLIYSVQGLFSWIWSCLVTFHLHTFVVVRMRETFLAFRLWKIQKSWLAFITGTDNSILYFLNIPTI